MPAHGTAETVGRPGSFDAVIFDMDGLLLDTERIALSTFVEACNALQVGDQRAVFYRCIGTNSSRGREILREGLAGKTDHDAFATAWSDRYRHATTSQPIPLKGGASHLLARLSARQVPLAVATSTRSEEAREKLARVGIGHYFRAIVGGDQVARSKPHPDIYLHAATVLGVPPRGCLALEDSENGVRSAVAAGMTVIQIPDLVPPSDDLRRLGHHIVERLDLVDDLASFVPVTRRGDAHPLSELP